MPSFSVLISGQTSPIEQGNREAVKFGIRGLRYDLVEDLVLGMKPDPVGDGFAKAITVDMLRGREDLQANRWNCAHTPPGPTVVGALGRVNTVLFFVATGC